MFQKTIATYLTQSRKILEEVEKIISSEPTTQREVEKSNTKFYRWRYGTVQGQILVKPVTNGKNCQNQK